MNFVRGSLDLVAAPRLLVQVAGFDLHPLGDAGACIAGLLVMGLFAARVFGPLHGGAR